MTSRLLSFYACVVSLLCVLLVLLNDLELSQVTHLLCSLAYLFFAFLLGWRAKQGGISILVFLFALTPTLNYQITSVLPFLTAPKALTGAGLVTGFVMGDACKRFLSRKQSSFLAWELPPTLNFICLFISISVTLAIARNLWLSASTFSFEGLLFNSSHFHMNAWRDDYFPLNELFYYGLAAALINSIIVNVSNSKNPEALILKPLLWGVIVAAAWGVLQNKTGIGLPYSSASGNRYYQGFGFASAGFQPDIHAFSGHMLLGAVGAWGCWFLRNKSFSRALIVAAFVMGWIGLIMSKSRGAVILALLAYTMALGIMLWRKSKLYFFVTTTVILFSILAIYLFHRWGMSIIPLGLIQYSESLPKLNINNLAVLNEHFGYRAEIYHAALRMFNAFPLMGLGQGEFYRMSGLESFARSTFLGKINGENAHNYFLQILTETGLIGFSLCAFALIKPVSNLTAFKAALPSIVMLIAFGLGNFFAHALLIKENFFLFCCVLGLMYVQTQNVKSPPIQSRANQTGAMSQTQRSALLVIMGLVLFILAAREIYTSFGKFPYTYGLVCHRAQPAQNNEWSSGLIEFNTPQNTRLIEINISAVPPDVLNKPLLVEWLSISQQGQLGASQYLTIDKPGPQKLTLQLMPSSEVGGRLTTKIILSRCFTPRNLGINTDPRRLGILIRDVEFIE